MTPENARKLGAELRKRREALGLSLRQLEELSGVDDTTIVRLEAGRSQRPATEKLQRLAVALDVPLEDLLITAGIQTDRGLPTLRPYMRTKYPQLPEEAQVDLDRYLGRLAKRYGVSLDGPAPGEDEEPEPPKRRRPTDRKGGRNN
jgi:transcriptional regulator with XRE-family HTH domain